MSKIFKILVVEDESITAMELQKKLVSWGYAVLGVVSSGENAVEKAFELKPDLILMDIILKGDMTGIDAAGAIKNKVEIPIIYLTAYCNDETFEGAKITQPAAYLIKPFQESELRFAIEMAFYGHQSRLKLMERIQKSLDERDLLIRDIHNIVKNNLKRISTILNRQSDYIKDNQLRQMFQESGNRVKVLELIHEKFSQSEDLANLEFADYLSSLVDLSFKFYESQRDNVEYKVNSEEILLNIDTAIPLGLIAYELVSNSLKHAFSENRGGEINLQLDNTDSNLIMDVKDNGVGLPPTFNFEESESVGFKIVKTLVDEINAEIEVKNESGVHVMIKIPKNSLDC